MTPCYKVSISVSIETHLHELYHNDDPDCGFSTWIIMRFNGLFDAFWMTVTFDNEKDYNWFLMHL